MFGLDGDFIYTLCAACGSLSQSEQDFNMARYYPPEYYSFSADKPFPRKAKAACFIGRMLPVALARVAGYFSYSLGQVARVRTEVAGWYGQPRHSARVLDVGCGAGLGLLRYHYAGYRVEGLDPFYHGENPAEFPIHRVPLEQLNGCYDVITFNHSFEHLPQPRQELKHVFRLLAADGVCVIKLPKLPSAAFDSYGEYWFALDAPRHYFIPTVRGLKQLAESVGFHRVLVTDQREDQNYFWSEAYRRGKTRHGSRLKAIFSATELERMRQAAAAAHARNESCHGTFVLHKD
jgi:SAM-dependent methyltransferase